jgi:multimeric flavodoxin WrbA
LKILALIGSPRKGGNTDILVDKLLEGAKMKEHSMKISIYINTTFHHA